MINETLGLRERKRLETRAQLERAAVLLAQEVGLENTTVDAICASVPVSPRTFFNYFESKEDAVLGVRDIPIDDELVAAHLASTAGESLTAQVIGLLLHALGPGIADTELHEARLAIVRQHPSLLTRQIAQMTRMGEQLTAATATLLSHDPSFAAVPADERNTLAELILPLCGGAVRVAVKEWVAAGGDRSPHELSRRAVELAGKAIETLR
ncbi:TetR/AcrR family transcriptional regulator [Leifsonia poae]|uniref:TetR family transcriptional regulator n=1 Tax=Leifsonia poae TaxID=110933 RepID=A0A9W6HDN0_9MICO|nr:TetR/AcrR family transcriptional regulator [Leifsonia poae]GLJ77828.1 TetR family transcriptional regulator [Leifsonia poae]